MWEQTLATTTDLPVERLWAVVADVRNWPDWWPGEGGGRTVEEAVPPARMVVVGGRFLARTETRFEFRPSPAGTRVRVGVRVGGALGLVRAGGADGPDLGLSALVRRLLDRARLTPADDLTPRGAPR